MLKRLPTITFAIALVLAMSVFATACANQAEQLNAATLDPIVTDVCDDLDAYLDAGIKPDGSAMSEGEKFQKRGSVIILRNALHEGMGREKEPLPVPAGLPPEFELGAEGGDPEDEDEDPGLSTAGR